MTREHLVARIQRVIRGGTDPGLALDIHRFQHAHDPVLRALWPTAATRVQDIPAVPVSLFQDVEVGTVKSDMPHVAFHTSGTTGARPGVHRCRDTLLYDEGCALHARPWLPDTRQTLALLPDRATSSLAHMIRGFAPHTGPVHFLADDDGFQFDRLEQLDRPTFLCTTAFALDAWIHRGAQPLPAGSRVMVTGGFKGRDNHLDADALLTHTLTLAEVVLEYGMTELSSQLWADVGEPYSPPPWLTVIAVDPATGAVLPPEQPGQLRFLDLCNLDSTVLIETMDEGAVHADGRVTLLGRLQEAPLRGCSLAAEELL